MGVVIDHEAIRRQVGEIEEAEREREHRGDVRRRRTIQALAAIGLVGSGARELYRREILDTLPTARYRLSEDDEPLETTLEPVRDAMAAGLGKASAHAGAVVLSAIGGSRRAEERPWLSVASAGFLALRAVISGRELVEDLEEGSLDAVKAVDAITSAASLPLALPEAIRAVRSLLDR